VRKERIDGVLHFISCKHYSHPGPSFIEVPGNLGASQLSWESFTMAVDVLGKVWFCLQNCFLRWRNVKYVEFLLIFFQGSKETLEE
jgi:hypothetical protein